MIYTPPYWFISDMGCQHLLRRDGCWYKLPLTEGDEKLLLTFKTEAEANAFCDGATMGKCYVSPLPGPPAKKGDSE